MTLRPLAEIFLSTVALGMIGIGLQAVPVWQDLWPYAISEGLGIKKGLGKALEEQGILFDFSGSDDGREVNLWGVNTMKALYYSAVVNGVVAVPLILLLSSCR